MFAFIRLCKHFRKLQCIFIIKLTVFFEKEMYFFLLSNHYSTHTLARVFFFFLILLFCLGQNLLPEVLMCYVVSAYEKESRFSSFSTRLLPSILYKKLSNCRSVLNVLTALSTSFRQFVEKIGNLRQIDNHPFLYLRLSQHNVIQRIFEKFLILL